MLALWTIHDKVAEEELKKRIVCQTTNKFPIRAIPNRISLTGTQPSATAGVLIPTGTFVKRGTAWHFKQMHLKYRSGHSNSISVTKCLLQLLHLYNGNDI